MIKATDAMQGGPQPDPAVDVEAYPPFSPPVLRSATENGLPPSAGPEPVEGVQIESVSRAEKRRLLAQIIRVNPFDCFDESGAFDLARAQRLLPPCAIHHLTVHETTRTDRNGNTTVRRRITLRLVDKIRAMREDDILEEKQEKAVESAAVKKVAQLEKALTEGDDRDLRSSRDIEEKDRQIEALQHALKLAETRHATLLQSTPPASETPGAASERAGQIEEQRRNWEEIEVQSRIRQIEHHKNTSGHLGFCSRYPKWPEDAEARRAYALRLIKMEAETAEREKIASAQRAADRELAERARRPARARGRP